MRKLVWKLTFFILLIALSISLVACTNTSAEENNGTKPPANGSESNEPGVEIEKPTPPVAQTEKFYVNVNNYSIKPVNPENTTKPVLITFDDTPKGAQTYKILDTLDKYNAKAIFFVTGYYADSNRELIKEIYDRGHIVGNHTWGHQNLNEVTTREATESQINRLNDLIEEITGDKVKYLRPPYGAHAKNPYLNDILIEQNIQKMNWSFGYDWQIVNPERATELIDKTTESVFSGANILMHDIEITEIALDQMLANMQEKGYTFVLPTEIVFE
jgi:peptidoglycan/xylan/chitin deacetylase (PgdA/CDA1 family)